MQQKSDNAAGCNNIFSQTDDHNVEVFTSLRKLKSRLTMINRMKKSLPKEAIKKWVNNL